MVRQRGQAGQGAIFCRGREILLLCWLYLAVIARLEMTVAEKKTGKDPICVSCRS